LIDRTPIAVFAPLPETIRRTLEAEGCRVPQPSRTLLGNTYEPANMTVGRFFDPERYDWAVLCSVGGVSSIRVFWGEDGKAFPACPGRIAEAPDSAHQQDIGGNPAYSRMISRIDPKTMRERLAAHGQPAPGYSFEHEGIEDAFMGKGSTIHYCEGGEWHVMLGAD